MAQPAANLRVRISADLADIKQGLGLLRGELAKVKSQAAQALPGNNAFVNGIKRARNELAAFVGVYLSLRGVSILGGIADEATQIRGRIRAAKGDYEAILALAQETRSGLTSTVDLYTRLERSTRTQGVNQERLLGITKAVNQALKLSYATTASGEAVIIQLGQGLSSGTLRGEELNSVMEQTPRLAQAIADGLGKPLGALRALAKEGKLTTSQIIKALEDQAAVLEAEYSKVPITIADAITQVRNSFLDYVGDQDAATGASRRFAQALQQLAKDLPKYLDPLLAVVGQLIKNFDTLAVFFITRMAAAAIPALINGFVALRAAIIATTASAVTLRGALALLGGPIGIAIAALAAGIYYLYQRTQQAKVATEEHTTALEANKNMAYQSAAAATAEAKAKREQALRTLQAAQAILAEKQARSLAANDRATLIVGEGRANSTGRDAAVARSQAQQARSEVAAAKREFDDWGRRLVELAMQANDEVLNTATTAVATATEKTGKAVAASNALLRDSISRALAELDRLYEAHEIGISEYFAARQDLQEQAIDAEIAQAQAELAVTKEVGQRRKIEEDIIKLQRDRAEIAVIGARAQKAAEEDLAKQLGEVKIRLLELDGETGRAARAQLEGEYLELFKRLEAASDEAGQAMVRNLIERLVGQAQLEQIREAADKITGNLQGLETSISAQADAGMLGQLEGERQLMVARQLAITQLQQLRTATLESMAAMAPGSPEHDAAVSGLRDIDTNIANITASMQKYRQQVADAAVDSVTNLFMDLVEGSKSAGEALRDFVRGFALAMAQIAARALATYLVLQLLDAIYPGLGKATAATMQAGVHHAGGIAGEGGRKRGISSLLMGFAPRYHKGGIAGLGQDEVPAVLQKGEEVLMRNDPRHRRNGGLGGERSLVTTPIVAIGDNAIADAMAGAAGENITLTHVRNNWDSLTRGGNG